MREDPFERTRPWHTDGYMLLTSVLLYAEEEYLQGNWSAEQYAAVLPILIACGKAIRQEYS